MISDSLTLKGNVLRARGELLWDSDAEFSLMVDDLLLGSDDEIKLDLREVSFIYSPFLGRIVKLHFQCTQFGKTLRLEISPALESTFRDAGLFKQMDVSVASAAV